MGRLWQSLILSRWNPLFEWLPIESVIHAHQQGYYDALAISNKANDATVFVEFMLEVILETLEEVKVQDRIEEFSAEYVVLPSLKPKEREVFEQVKAYLEQYGNIGNQQAQELTGLSAAHRPTLFIVVRGSWVTHFKRKHKRKVIHITLERKESALFSFFVSLKLNLF